VTNRNPYEYVKHPDKNDSICLRDIKNAINDSAKGIIKFCIPIGSGSSPKRCEKQLRTLCKQYGMQIEPIFISDEIVEGQTQGCYCVYMDNLIAQKFGPSFKTYLINTADSLLANSNDTIN
jgi:hypothetical protein